MYQNTIFSRQSIAAPELRSSFPLANEFPVFDTIDTIDTCDKWGVCIRVNHVGRRLYTQSPTASLPESISLWYSQLRNPAAEYYVTASIERTEADTVTTQTQIKGIRNRF